MYNTYTHCKKLELYFCKPKDAPPVGGGTKYVKSSKGSLFYDYEHHIKQVHKVKKSSFEEFL